MIPGSPSRLRSAETVIRTALVKGSAFSSHARARRSSALTTPPSAATRTSSPGNCFPVSATHRPPAPRPGQPPPGPGGVPAVAVDLAAERIQTQARDLPHGRPAVRAPAVEGPEPEDELAEVERIGEGGGR